MRPKVAAVKPPDANIAELVLEVVPNALEEVDLMLAITTARAPQKKEVPNNLTPGCPEPI